MAISYPLPWPSGMDGRPLAPARLDLHVSSATRSGGASLTGDEQIVVSPAARWEAKVTMPTLRPEDVLAWRGFVAAMQGRFGSVWLPAFEAGRQPWPVDPYGVRQVPALARNPALAGTAYAVDPVQDAAADILVTVDAAPVNATVVTLTVGQGSTILAGQRFALNGRLHEIMQVQVQADPARYTVDIRPWLLVAAVQGASAEFRAPLCRMRFATDTEGTGDLDLLRFMAPTLNLIEAQ